jgi:hypothetical protein
VKIHRDGATQIAADFQVLVDDLGKFVANYETQPKVETSRQATVRAPQSVQNPLFRGRARRRL